MKRSGTTDLPLHGGKVPSWLYERMGKMGLAIIRVIIEEYGRHEVLKRLSDPFWFQSFGAVLGMDWHSSGITTSVLGALKKSVNPHSKELGLYFCGGRGKQSRKTPRELYELSMKNGFDGEGLIRASKLSAKIDNTAIQDGFQLYLHSFILSAEGDWSVVQQGMQPELGFARRYHWHSGSIDSWVIEPHTSIYGKPGKNILNLVSKDASGAQQGILDILDETPGRMMKEVMHMQMPSHHDVRTTDIDLKRLGSVLYLAYENDLSDFEGALLLPGMGPRTLQSLALVSEVIFGTPTRFSDPARFSFAHGGKDGHPSPVPLTVYDETIDFLNKTVDKAVIDRSDKIRAMKKIHAIAKDIEGSFIPDASRYQDFLEHERKKVATLGGRTVMDDGPGQKLNNDSDQLSLF